MFSLVFLCLFCSASNTKIYDATFRNCYDGDTCTFDLILSDQTSEIGLNVLQRIIVTRQNQTLRLCDINAPEMKPGPNPAAIKARDDLVSWIKNAKTVKIEVPQKPSCVASLAASSCDDYEKYGRLLAYIVADGVNLNLKQLQQKNAVAFIQCR